MVAVWFFVLVGRGHREGVWTLGKILDSIESTPGRPWIVCRACRDYVTPSHRCLAPILDKMGNSSTDRSLMLDDLIEAVERVRDSIRELNEAIEAIR